MKPFKFLYVFKFTRNKPIRKSYHILVKAYLTEFTKKDNVLLILKVYNKGAWAGSMEVEILRNLKEKGIKFKENSPPIEINTKTLSQKGLVELYKEIDLYISVDRANGWGMPCMEAMSVGTPAASIDWSGSTEFMNKSNSLQIKHKGLEPVDMEMQLNHPANHYGHKWAKVPIKNIQKVMRWAYENPEELAMIGIRGMKTIRGSNESML